MKYMDCISFTLAQQTVAAAMRMVQLRKEVVPLEEALERTAAQDIASEEEVPPFNRSTVDGFAVRSVDTFGAGEGAPALLEVSGEVMIGNEPQRVIGAGEALVIPTGGMLPVGADAVLMLEYAELPDATTLLVGRVVAPGENVIRRGEDVARGDMILQRGQRITPRHIGLLAACGCAELTVYCRPKITIISTGDELVDLRVTPRKGQIRDVNSYLLAALLRTVGCTVCDVGIVRDDGREFAACLAKNSQSSDVVILSGGSSVGARDYTVQAIEDQPDGKIVFHGVAMKPGKPTIFGLAGGVPVFGLPGHPAAALTVGEQLVLPAIAELYGREGSEDRLIFPVRMGRNVASAPGRDDFIPVRLETNCKGYIAEPILGKSGLIAIQRTAHGVLHISADKSGVYQDEIVNVQLLRQII